MLPITSANPMTYIPQPTELFLPIPHFPSILPIIISWGKCYFLFLSMSIWCFRVFTYEAILGPCLNDVRLECLLYGRPGSLQYSAVSPHHKCLDFVYVWSCKCPRFSTMQPDWYYIAPKIRVAQCYFHSFKYTSCLFDFKLTLLGWMFSIQPTIEVPYFFFLF